MAPKPRNLKTKIKKICEKCLMDNNHPFAQVVEKSLNLLVSQMKNY